MTFKLHPHQEAAMKAMREGPKTLIIEIPSRHQSLAPKPQEKKIPLILKPKKDIK